MKSAPLPVVSWVAVPFGRHRYACTQCARPVWTRRLRRRTTAGRPRTDRRDLRGREIAFFASLLLAILVAIVLLANSCRTFPGEPVPPADPNIIRPGL